MNFDDALKLMRVGQTAKRKEWPKDVFLKIENGILISSKAGMVTWPLDIVATDWTCPDWGTFYDQGYDEGYKVGYDEAIEKYLDALDKLAASGGHELRNILLALKRQSSETHKSE